MSKVNTLTASFITITNALYKVKNQDDNNIYVSMLDKAELECLTYAQRLRTYTNRQLASPPTDTDESKRSPRRERERSSNVA